MSDIYIAVWSRSREVVHVGTSLDDAKAGVEKHRLVRDANEQSELWADDHLYEPLTADEWAELRELEAEYWYDPDDDESDALPCVCHECGGDGQMSYGTCRLCDGLGTLT